MADFAELDSNNVVIRVLVVADKDASDANNIIQESIGADFCNKVFGGTWKLTNTDSSFRKNRASVNYTYDPAKNAFIPPKPFPSWLLNETTCRWGAPVPYPQDTQLHSWDEATVSWVPIKPLAQPTGATGP